MAEESKSARRSGRPSTRKGLYKRITIEVSQDILDYVESQKKSRREVFELMLRRAMTE